jgi:hypothetical protein
VHDFFGGGCGVFSSPKTFTVTLRRRLLKPPSSTCSGCFKLLRLPYTQYFVVVINTK